MKMQELQREYQNLHIRINRYVRIICIWKLVYRVYIIYKYMSKYHTDTDESQYIEYIYEYMSKYQNVPALLSTYTSKHWLYREYIYKVLHCRVHMRHWLVCVCVYTCVCVCVCVCVYTYIYCMCVHTYCILTNPPIPSSRCKYFVVLRHV
jgi:hypothetical protein